MFYVKSFLKLLLVGEILCDTSHFLFSINALITSDLFEERTSTQKKTFKNINNLMNSKNNVNYCNRFQHYML